MQPLDANALTEAHRILGYEFQDPMLLAEALTHASYTDDPLESNERMEFLGDAILGAIICEYLYQHYPDQREGVLTKLKSAVVSRRVCAIVAENLGLPDLLSLGKGMTGQSDLPSSLAAAVYESIVAAIYLDGGIEPVRDFILRDMTEHIEEAAASSHQQNYKSVLQQYAQRQLTSMPNYILIDEKGPDHSKAFEVCVDIANVRYPSAWGQSKKEAEQRAALLALNEMGVISIHGDDSSDVRVGNSETKNQSD